MAFKRRAWTIFEWLGPTDGQTILDCGCGRGFYLKMLRHLGNARLFGVDLELPYLRKARRNTAHLPAVLVGNASIYDLPFPDETFDAVILSEILHMSTATSTPSARFAAFSSRGGLALPTVPHANYPFWWDPINKTLETLFHTHIGRGPLAWHLGPSTSASTRRRSCGRRRSRRASRSRRSALHPPRLPVRPQPALRARQAAPRIRALRTGSCRRDGPGELRSGRRQPTPPRQPGAQATEPHRPREPDERAGGAIDGEPVFKSTEGAIR